MLVKSSIFFIHLQRSANLVSKVSNQSRLFYKEYRNRKLKYDIIKENKFIKNYQICHNSIDKLLAGV